MQVPVYLYHAENDWLADPKVSLWAILYIFISTYILKYLKDPTLNGCTNTDLGPLKIVNYTSCVMFERNWYF